jgi:hypothetical protein
MKTIYKLLPILFIVVLFSCDGGGNGTDPEPATFEEKLAGTWSMSSVKIDGSDVSSDYSGFSITFDASLNYTISNGGTTFTQTSGQIPKSWDGDLDQVTVGLNGITNQVTLALSNENKTLTLSFSVDNNTFGGGRESGIAGNYVFVLNK